MLLRQTTAPQTEPITTQDVEAQIKYQLLDDQVALVDMYIRAVRARAEAITRRALVTQSYELVLDGFPSGRDAIKLPLPPLQTVDSITYVDTDGATQTLDPLTYRVIAEISSTCPPGYIIPVYGLSWPVTRDDVAVVRIAFTCGYGPLAEGGSSNVPDGILLWMMLQCAGHNETREAFIVSLKEQLVDLRTIGDVYLDDYRVRSF